MRRVGRHPAVVSGRAAPAGENNFRFTVSERAAANVDTIKRSSNNVIDFMESEGYFRFKADYSISSKEFYDIYKQWCEDNACHSVSAIRFSAELAASRQEIFLDSVSALCRALAPPMGGLGGLGSSDGHSVCCGQAFL